MESCCQDIANRIYLLVDEKKCAFTKGSKMPLELEGRSPSLTVF